MTIYRDQLEKVYALIEKPENWTRGVTARDKDGNSVGPNSQHASCWCVIGAFMRLDLADGWEIPTRLLMGDELTDQFIRGEATGGVADINDNKGHAEVLALLKSAIDRAPVREGAV